MEAPQRYCEGEGRKRFRVFKAVYGIGKEFVVATVKYVGLTIITVTFLLGITTAYDIFIGDRVPHINYLGKFSPEFVLANRSPTRPIGTETEAEMWNALQPSLQILDRVCPDASAWARDRHSQGKLNWDSSDGSLYAKYNYGTGEFTINPSLMFLNNHGRIASIVAHEFRHSRQNFSKFFRSVVACAVLREPKDSIVEDDAELFEAQVLIAIFH